MSEPAWWLPMFPAVYSVCSSFAPCVNERLIAAAIGAFCGAFALPYVFSSAFNDGANAKKLGAKLLTFVVLSITLGLITVIFVLADFSGTIKSERASQGTFSLFIYSLMFHAFYFMLLGLNAKTLWTILKPSSSSKNLTIGEP